MKVKVFDLTGCALDWAVAKCEGINQRGPDNPVDRPMSYTYRPSTDWAQGGPIIERERIELVNTPCDEPNKAIITPDASEPRLWFVQYGPTPLVAAMRCYVAVKLGGEVEIPEELTV